VKFDQFLKTRIATFGVLGAQKDHKNGAKTILGQKADNLPFFVLAKIAKKPIL
jgi:hypothetical protein